jgi:uracil-DNA glycosylase
VPSHASLQKLLREVRACRACEKHLPHGPNPVLQADVRSKILIISQAPGTKVHATSTVFNDKSGDRLRAWMGVSREEFYDPGNFSVMPMGFCYPGRGKSGDLPPRKECAPLWHGKITEAMPSLRLKILVGSYAQKHYLAGRMKENMTGTVRAWKEYLPEFFPVVHPSPRNQIWLKKHPWFERDVVPALAKAVRKALI